MPDQDWKARHLNRRWVILSDGEVICELPVEGEPRVLAANALLIENAPHMRDTLDHIVRLCRGPERGDTEAFITSVCDVAVEAAARTRA